MADFQIERAERKQAKARVALTGVSGSGKTMGALLMAKGLVEYMLQNGMLHGTLQGKIGLIDTERKSGSLYAHLFPYDVINLDAPYTTERYVKAIKTFENADYAAIIIDSASHQWSGKGGTLEQVGKLNKSSNRAFGAWDEVKPDEEEFWEAMLESRAHMFVTMRSKSAYVINEVIDHKGRAKIKPQKIGMKPIQREGLDYEFTTVLDLEVGTNRASTSKDRTGLFKETVVLSSEWGHRLGHWLLSGAESTMLPPTAKPIERLYAVVGVAQRAIDRARTLPDLEREFTQGVADVQAIRKELTDIEKAEIKPQIDHLIQVKDLRKAKLSPAVADHPEAGISIEDAAALEQLCMDTMGQTDVFLEKFRIQRFAQLPQESLAEAKDWLLKSGDAMAGVLAMKDDIPQ